MTETRVDSQLVEAIAGAKRVRWAARAWVLVAALACLIVEGRHWMAGVLLGGLVVELNLALLLRTLARAGQWRGRSLWPTVIWFYVLFGCTIIFCVTVIRSGWGHPLGFLLGLLSLFGGLAVALVSFLVKKPGPSNE